MTDQALRTVGLPDGKEVTVSDTPIDWWTEQFASGFVHPRMCAPDPKQPRKHIDPVELEELLESVSQSGVRESVTVTPRHLAPWVQLAPKFADVFFVIVSGHRRWNGATRAKLEAMPIRVRIYESEMEHYLDASLLNSNRKDLTPLEEGYEVIQLRDLGWTLEALAKHFGRSVPYLYGRMNLTRLVPDIQTLLNPEIKEKKRLPVTIGGALGAVEIPTVEEMDEIFELLKKPGQAPHGDDVSFADLDEDGRRFELQRIFLRAIQEQGMSSTRAITLVKEHSLKLGAQQARGGRPVTRFRPEAKRKMLRTFLEEIVGSAVFDWRPADLDHAFETASVEEIDAIIESFDLALQDLEGLFGLIKKIRAKREPLSEAA